ncbi:MAG: hypothetical protein CVT59_05765 [Actinobacteria bacterium HGW-Actinobacteria-1]|jgi:hypothetical protein|nr:MAG: hypothetical protein CVT59_05765 [Actinobacteria bacterium HGW-Actinobacteria-1]
MAATDVIERPATSGSMGSDFASLPTSKVGRVSMWLALAFVVLFAINSFVFMPLGRSTNAAYNVFSQRVLPFYGVGMLLCGVAAGSVALLAIIKKRERSLVLWLALFPLAFTIFLLLGEFLVPH